MREFITKIKWGILGLAFTALGACSTTPNAINSLTTPQQVFISGCDSYNSLIVFLTQEASLKKLSSNQIGIVNQVRKIVYPICTSPMPSDITSANTQVLSGVSKLGAIKKTVK